MQRIKDWATDDRPREKLVEKGASQLSNAELLAILLGSGTRKMSAVDLSKQILSDLDNDLVSIYDVTLQQLMKYSGIGTAKAVTIISALELSKRLQINKLKETSVIKSSRHAYELLRPKFMHLKHEEFYAVYLNRANKVQRIEQISKGGISGTVADGKVIFNHALEYKSSAIILAHNHPSGQLLPSDADRSLTKKLKEFGKLIDLQILDHLILTTDNYFSFADEGII